MLKRLLAAFLFLVLVNSAQGQEEDSEKVYRAIYPSVVSIENLEMSGTGILISEDGLILTNAHVIMSPFPYQVKVDVGTPGTSKVATFKDVEIVGVHPNYDLALVRISPREPSLRLYPAQLSQEKPAPGKRVYAIGNPGTSELTLTKTITEGVLSGADRVIDGLTYYQFSAPINPGNSGGPLCDRTGQVIGIVTLKMIMAEGIGFAIPIREFNTQAFVSIDKRPVDKEKANELAKEAEEYAEVAVKIFLENGPEDKRRDSYNYIAAILYREALSHNPSDPKICYNLGMLYRSLDNHIPACAYLTRCISLEPWGVSGKGWEYAELGLALSMLKHEDEGMAAFLEGVAKFPARAGQIWDHVAIHHFLENDYLVAAYAAREALATECRRMDDMKKLYEHARSKLDSKEIQELANLENAMKTQLKQSQERAQVARDQGAKYVTLAFVYLMEELNARGESGFRWADRIDLWKKEDKNRKEEQTSAPELDLTRWIRFRIALAQSYKMNGIDSQARKVLMEIVIKHADHPDARKARRLLESWK